MSWVASSVDNINNMAARYDAVVVGLGKTGFSCIRFLTQRGHRVAVNDTRPAPPYLDRLQQEFPHIPVSLGRLDEKLFLHADTIVISPGVSVSEKAITAGIERGVAVFGDIELFCRHATAPIVAITGSNGKSTVTTLFAQMVKDAGYIVKAGGNLGTPALDLLAEQQQVDFYVLELSSFQLDTTFSLNAHSAVVLNIAADHLDRYESMDAYVQSKRKVYQGSGAMIINADDAAVSAMVEHGRPVIRYAVDTPLADGFHCIHDDAGLSLRKDDQPLMRQSDLKIKGRHNIANVLAAMALADSIALPMDVVTASASRFTGLAHRCEYIGSYNDVRWYNDSKATNVHACCAAIDSLGEDKNIILIAGGDGKGADFSGLIASIRRFVAVAVLLGCDAKRIATCIERYTQVHIVATMDEAVASANDLANPGTIVLLSPACSSLDMFNDYQQRGMSFIDAARQWGVQDHA